MLITQMLIKTILGLENLDLFEKQYFRSRTNYWYHKLNWSPNWWYVSLKFYLLLLKLLGFENCHFGLDATINAIYVSVEAQHTWRNISDRKSFQIERSEANWSNWLLVFINLIIKHKSNY